MSTPRFPGLTRHRASGRAVVRLSGRDYYCGKFGTKAARETYDELIRVWLAHGRQMPSDDAGGPSVAAVLLAYLDHAERYYRRADGSQTDAIYPVRAAIRRLRERHGKEDAAAFGPRSLKALRETWVADGLSRKTCNDYTGVVKRAFKWAVSDERIPASVFEALRTVDGLRAGRSDAPEPEPVRPVPEGDIEKVLPKLPPPVAAMVRLMYLTGARVGEIVQMTTGTIDRSGSVWEFKPPVHKTQHRGRERIVPLGPKAQAVVKPWLRLDPNEPLFQPCEAEALRNAAKRAGRASPMTPSQRKRGKGARRRRAPGDRYTPDVVRRAIRRACERAEVTPWHPHQLRHNAATRLRRELGIEAARVVLGHTSPSVTEIYAEADVASAREAMAVHG